jgi:hypothetical protein
MTTGCIGQALARQTGCAFAVLFVELPTGLPPPDPAVWAADLGCVVQVVTRIRGHNLATMKHRQVQTGLLTGARAYAILTGIDQWMDQLCLLVRATIPRCLSGSAR